MQLQVLPRGDMADAPGVFIRNIRQTAQLRGRQATEGDLDPDHLNTFLPLPVDPVLQAETAEDFGMDFTLQEALGLGLKALDLLLDFSGDGLRYFLKVAEFFRVHVVLLFTRLI